MCYYLLQIAHKQLLNKANAMHVMFRRYVAINLGEKVHWKYRNKFKFRGIHKARIDSQNVEKIRQRPAALSLLHFKFHSDEWKKKRNKM